MRALLREKRGLGSFEERNSPISLFQAASERVQGRSREGLVLDTDDVSVFDHPGSVSSKGFTPHEIDQSTFPDELRTIQRGQDPHRFEVVPQPGANLTPEQFGACLSRIECY